MGYRPFPRGYLTEARQAAAAAAAEREAAAQAPWRAARAKSCLDHSCYPDSGGENARAEPRDSRRCRTRSPSYED